MNYKSIISTLVLIALVLPLVTPLLQILPVVTAQVNPEITNIYGGIFVEELGTISVYPGSTITVEVFTPYVTTFTIRVVNTFNTSIVYATQSFRPAEPGYVNVTLVLPKELPGLTRAAGILNVSLILGTTVVDSKLLSVLPMIEVTPSVTTIVDARGNPLNVTATVYGVPTNITVTSILINSYTIPVNLPADDKGVVTTTINLLNITGSGIPAGVYTVNFTTEEYGVPPEYFGTTTLTIRPQVVINPGAEPAGHGIYIYTPGADIGNDTINVVGYGFPANSRVTRIRLWNLNFTNVYYDFPLTNVNTDSNGYFTVSNLLGARPTNMTAGLYIPIVYLAPQPQTLSNTSTIGLGATGWVAVDLSKFNIPDLTGYVNATSQINGTLGYVTTVTTQSVNKNDVLSVDITDGALTYRLSANLIVNETGNYVQFALYNTTETPWKTLFNTTVKTTYNATIGANVSFVQFNLTGDYSTTPEPAGKYRFNATFYEYANQILLVLQEYRFQITGGLVTIVHTPSGSSVTYTTANLTVDGTTVKAPAWKFTHNGLTYEVNWAYDAQTNAASLSVTVTQPETAYEFRNAYYLVRPILLFLVDGKLYRSYPGAVMPGANITIVAFGYSPGYYWYNVPNILVVTLDKITPLWSGEVGKDGNVTFVVTIPKDTTWGAHYIHGIDSRTYEYSVAIVIGAKAVFIVELRPETNKVSASYYDTHIDACPCAVYEGKTFCDVCVVYTGDCDYLGDYVIVTVYGLQPGEKLLKVYLGASEVRSDLWFPSAPVADAQGILTFKFLVPSIPQGTYVVRIVTSVAGEIIAVWEKNTTINYVEVVPKLLLVTLDSNLTSGRAILPILVGSGIVRVIGTGFKPGITMDAVIVNMTDAMRMILANVRYWSVDEKGILVGGKFAGQDIYPAILFPVMQPGKYEIRLGYYDGATPLLSDPGFIYVVNNLTFVATVNDVNKVITTVNTGLSNMQTFINTTMTQLANQINTALGTLASKSDIDKVLTAISDVKSAVVSVNSTVAAVGSKVDTAVTTINSALASVRSDLSGSILAVAGKVDAILDKVTVIYDNVTMIGIKIEKLDNVVTKLDSLASQLAGAVNSINALSSKLDDLSRKVDAATSDVKTAVANVGNAVNAVSGKVDAVSSKVDNVGGTATNGMYVGVLALVFALLAMIFALLAYNTIRKSVAPK
ncbi:MAG: hypothetical protein QW211_02265 [Desulfurococcaceae archaeon]